MSKSIIVLSVVEFGLTVESSIKLSSVWKKNLLQVPHNQVFYRRRTNSRTHHIHMEDIATNMEATENVGKVSLESYLIFDVIWDITWVGSSDQRMILWIKRSHLSKSRRNF